MSQPAEQQGCNKNSSTKEPDIKKQEDIYEATDCLTKTDKVQIQEQIKDLPAKEEETLYKRTEPQPTNIHRILEVKEVHQTCLPHDNPHRRDGVDAPTLGFKDSSHVQQWDPGWHLGVHALLHSPLEEETESWVLTRAVPNWRFLLL